MSPSEPGVGGESGEAPAVCVVLHDVAPPTAAACARVLDAIDEVAPLPLTLLAVPRYHGAPRDAAFEQWLRLRAAGGDEIVLHGYTHRDDGVARGWVDRCRRGVYTRGEGEFCDLGRAEAERRLDAGLRWFASMGVPVRGFVAPAWLLGEAGWAALCERPFDYTCTLGGLNLLPKRERLPVLAQVYSSANGWRRASSIAWNGLLGRLQARQARVRLELHPHDADHAAVRRSWQRLLREHLRTRRAITLGAMAQEWRRSLAATSSAPSLQR